MTTQVTRVVSNAQVDEINMRFEVLLPHEAPPTNITLVVLGPHVNRLDVGLQALAAGECLQAVLAGLPHSPVHLLDVLGHGSLEGECLLADLAHVVLHEDVDRCHVMLQGLLAMGSSPGRGRTCGA